MPDPVTRLNEMLAGQSFLFVGEPESGLMDSNGGVPFMRLELVVNWFEELKQRAGN